MDTDIGFMGISKAMAMTKKHKRDKADEYDVTVGEIVLFRGEKRTIEHVYPCYGNLGHVRLNGKPGSRTVAIYSVTYIKRIERD